MKPMTEIPCPHEEGYGMSFQFDGVRADLSLAGGQSLDMHDLPGLQAEHVSYGPIQFLVGLEGDEAARAAVVRKLHQATGIAAFSTGENVLVEVPWDAGGATAGMQAFNKVAESLQAQERAFIASHAGGEWTRRHNPAAAMIARILEDEALRPEEHLTIAQGKALEDQLNDRLGRTGILSELKASWQDLKSDADPQQSRRKLGAQALAAVEERILPLLSDVPDEVKNALTGRLTRQLFDRVTGNGAGPGGPP